MKPIPKKVQMIHDFEKEAEEFLNTYGCGDAISTPKAVKVDQIIQRMSLKVVDTYVLSTDNSIQGAITFAQGQLTVYDQKRQELTVPYQKGTIFLDASIQNIRRKRNTMIHECFHWHKHRYFFENTADPASSLCHRCEYDKAQYSSKKGTRTTIDRIEWQARTIAPKILMPKPAAMKLMQKLLAEKK